MAVRVAEAVRPELHTAGSNDSPLSRSSSASSSGSMDYEGLYSPAPTCPLGGVAEVMRSNARGVLTCTANETLEEVVPRLSKVTGLPVISQLGTHVVGVISRKVCGLERVSALGRVGVLVCAASHGPWPLALERLAGHHPRAQGAGLAPGHGERRPPG